LEGQRKESENAGIALGGNGRPRRDKWGRDWLGLFPRGGTRPRSSKEFRAKGAAGGKRGGLPILCPPTVRAKGWLGSRGGKTTLDSAIKRNGRRTTGKSVTCRRGP